jgi:hypothetical protein
MDLQHFNVKFFVDQPETVDLSPFLAVFNSWIQDQVTDELLIEPVTGTSILSGVPVTVEGRDA